MTTGALIFAFNNEQTDFVKMAAWSSKNIKRHLGIPVAVVTDVDHSQKAEFDHYIQVPSANNTADNTRYFEDYDSRVTWHNTSRVDAYHLSPWDQTLVLDADYVVASNQLKVLFDTSIDFLAHRYARDITETNDFESLNTFGDNQMPMWWATVMLFRRSDYVESIFDCMSMIRDNWQHYREIYKNKKGTYRNDHALSIAQLIVNGHHIEYPSIPWQLASLTPQHRLYQIEQDHYRVEFQSNDNRKKWMTIQNHDFHAMGKKYLEEIVANST